jgi:hypothetical protein
LRARLSKRGVLPSRDREAVCSEPFSAACQPNSKGKPKAKAEENPVHNGCASLLRPSRNRPQLAQRMAVVPLQALAQRPISRAISLKSGTFVGVTNLL